MDTKGQELLKKYLAGNCTDQEKATLETWFVTHEPGNEIILKAADRQKDMQEIRLLLQQEIGSNRLLIRRIARIAVAASILLFMGFGFYYYRLNLGQKEITRELANNFMPGSNKAFLTLSSGKKILLTSAQNGPLATEGKTAINKTANGQIVYHSLELSTDVVVFNTLSTPRGGQYNLTLADGSKVWLNSASSIRYPANFANNLRQVSITGEAYFEVAHNASKPFQVISNGQIVEVLGTHFNINAYENEASVKTTLMEGAVRIAANGSTDILKPGQQAIVNGNRIQLIDADTDETISWKDGYFDFSGADINTVMRQLSRWYDADIEFEGPVSGETFTGRIPRSWNLAQAIKMIQSTNAIHLTIQGRRIMVKK